MRNSRKVLLRFIVLGLLPFCITTAASALTAEQIAEKALAATVYLEMEDRNGQSLGFGSGFFVGQNQIATNFHVIAGAARGIAKLVDKPTTYAIEGIIATDEENDLAILEVRLRSIQPLPLGDSNTVNIGETVYVAGNPKGWKGTFSDGIISSRREMDAKKRLQMTAPISPGSSGGPVLNREGEVIGVSFMTIEGGQNLNFAIPSNYLKELLDRSETAQLFPQDEQSISAETYYNWGNIMHSLELYNEAIVEYNKAINLKPNYVRAYNNRGFMLNKLERYEEAIEDFDEAIRLKPDFAIAYSNRGIAKKHLEQYVAAIADFDEAIRLKPDLAAAYSNRAAVKGDLGQHLAAIADYDTAIRLKPDHAIPYNGRGLAKSRLQQYITALRDFDEAIRLKPDYAIAYNHRAVAKLKLERNEEAIGDFDEAIRLKPDYAIAYVLRGGVKTNLAKNYLFRDMKEQSLSQFREAKRDCQTALELVEGGGDESLTVEIERLLMAIDDAIRLIH